MDIINKWQINIKLTWVSHISMESWICISVQYQIDVVKWYGFSYRFLSFIWYWFFFYQQFMILEDGNIIHSIYFFSHFKKCTLKKLVESSISTTSGLKFSCSTGDEWNIVYNKKKFFIKFNHYNNYLHVCHQERIFVIKNLQGIC